MQFNEKLRILRNQHGLSLRQLGDELGYSRYFIHELECGKSHPNVEHAIKISRFFGVSLDMLLKDELDLDVDDEP